MIDPKQRFHALDGIRGIAAIAVMVCHFTEHNGLHWLVGSWVAVDIFFILSGFVIMHSYGSKIDAGLRWADFMVLRVVRLGPLYLLGLVLGLVAALLHAAQHPESPAQADSIAKAAALGSLLIPYLNDMQWSFGADYVVSPVFPLNDPAWSLFFEMFVNVVFFFYVLRLKNINHRHFVVASVLVFAAVTVLFHQLNPGWGTQNFIFGFPRVIAEFFLGTLIYRLHGQFKMPPRAVSVAVFVVVVGCFFTPLSAVGMVNAFLLAPILIALFSRLQLSAELEKLCEFLGEISYPLYITHYPIDRLMLEVYDTTELSPAFQVLSTCLIAVLCATALARLDKRVRRRILARATPTRSGPSDAGRPA